MKTNVTEILLQIYRFLDLLSNQSKTVSRGATGSSFAEETVGCP